MNGKSFIKQSTLKVPSYLRAFESDYDHIQLIYCEKISEPCYTGHIVESVNKTENSFIEETLDSHELTGDPLKIDLGGDEIIPIKKVEPLVINWLKEEIHHFPFTVKEARRELNNILKKSDSKLNNLPIYIICNGDDSEHTILLGANYSNLMACTIQAIGFFGPQDIDVKLHEMIAEHCRKCNNKDNEIKYVTKIKYNIFGDSLQNCPLQNESMRDLEKHASITVDVASDEKCFRILDNTQINMIMNMEIIAGHKLSKLNFLWEELCTLHTYIDISESSINEETILCDNPQDSDIILQNISRLITIKFLRSSPKNVTLDLDNLRGDDFLDGLWNILKYCENIFVLRNSFHFLFEELANSNVQVINIKDSYSNISFILNGILQKTVVLSAVTTTQCIELIFELGAQKLKYDFQTILGHYSNIATNNIESMWRTFYQKKETTKRNTVRTTRVTQCLESSNNNTKQLAYLTQLYVASEFIYFLDNQITVHEDSFHKFCQHVLKEYVENSKVYEEFLEVQQSPLCRISFALDKKNIDIIKNVHPSRWTMSMTSEVGTTQVNTIYDLSDTPIFPPSIYSYGDALHDDTKLKYYVCKLHRTKELF